MQQHKGRRLLYEQTNYKEFTCLCANLSVLYHLSASQIVLRALWITDVHNWCSCIELWTNPLFFLAVTQRAPVKPIEGLVQISKITLVTKGLGTLEILSLLGAGRLCAHSINTGICLCKLIFNLLPTWCWALDVTQWKAELVCPKINAQVHLHPQMGFATRGNDLWCCVMVAGPEPRTVAPAFAPFSKTPPTDTAFLPSALF